MGEGPVVIGFDGSPASERAVYDTARLLPNRRALVVHVWEPGEAIDALTPMMGLAPIDIRAAIDLEQELAEAAQRMAEHGTRIARESGLEAEGLAVADEITVSATLIRLASENDASAISVGSHGHRALREVLLGSTTREVIRSADCPVIVTRAYSGD
jgi:nucleotide-binding universal stress UspA family protein